MKKIVIITHEPLTRNLKRFFYIEDYINAGFEVAVWDISRILYNGLKLADEADESYIIKFKSFLEYKEQVEKTDTKNTIFVLEVPDIWYNREIYRTLSDNNCYWAVIDHYGNTILKTIKGEMLKKLVSIGRYPSLIRMKWDQRRYASYRKKHNMKGFDHYFTSSSVNPLATDYINHPDYELYIEQKKKVDNSDISPYILFIDNYFPLHPDFEIFRKLKVGGAKEYQDSLRRFFDFLESNYNMPVIIAAHPKANYTDETFGNREIIKYKTVDLVINANSVILHTSNSMSYVLLENKPFVLITTNGYEKVKHLSRALKKISKILSHQVYNIDTEAFGRIQFIQTPDYLREDYIDTYLRRKEIEGMRNADILIRTFREANL